MQYKKPEYCAMIEDYINSFRNRQGAAPSAREISSGVGLAVSTVSKYLSYMRENGMLDYDGHVSDAHEGGKRQPDGRICPSNSGNLIVQRVPKTHGFSHCFTLLKHGKGTGKGQK